MKKRRFPDSLVLIFAMIAMAQVLTYLLPKGEFDREGRSVIAGTYHLIDAPDLPAWATLSSIARGMKDAADIIFLVFIVGGAIGVIRASGAITFRQAGTTGRPWWAEARTGSTTTPSTTTADW